MAPMLASVTSGGKGEAGQVEAVKDEEAEDRVEEDDS